MSPSSGGSWDGSVSAVADPGALVSGDVWPWEEAPPWEFDQAPYPAAWTMSASTDGEDLSAGITGGVNEEMGTLEYIVPGGQGACCDSCAAGGECEGGGDGGSLSSGAQGLSNENRIQDLSWRGETQGGEQAKDWWELLCPCVPEHATEQGCLDAVGADVEAGRITNADDCNEAIGKCSEGPGSYPACLQAKAAWDLCPPTNAPNCPSNTKEEEKRCGPNVTIWLVSTLRSHYGAYEWAQLTRKDVNRARLRYNGFTPYELWRKNLETGNPYDFNKYYDFSVSRNGSTVCPVDCDASVMICGICTDDNVPEDIHFAYTSRIFAPNWMARLGADYVAVGGTQLAFHRLSFLTSFGSADIEEWRDNDTAHQAFNIGFALPGHRGLDHRTFCKTFLASVNKKGSSIRKRDCPKCEHPWKLKR